MPHFMSRQVYEQHGIGLGEAFGDFCTVLLITILICRNNQTSTSVEVFLYLTIMKEGLAWHIHRWSKWWQWQANII